VGRRTTVAEVREGRTYYGRAWTVGEYPDLIRPSILNVGVGEGGVGILNIMSRLRLADGDIDQVVADYAPWITHDDVEAAIAYYNDAPDRYEIDERLMAQVRNGG
jgi:hypothetical protein